MRKNVYKLITVFLCIINIFQYNTYASDEWKPTYSDEALEIAYKSLINMNLWADFDASDKYITRAEVAEWICRVGCRLRGIKHGVEDGVQMPKIAIYADVSEEYWAFNSIFNCTCYINSDPSGYWIDNSEFDGKIIRIVPSMIGYGNGYFCPDDYITYREFAKVLVCMLGWGYYTEYFEGGYPDGYISVADKLGIFPIEKEKLDQPVVKDDAIIMIYNTFKAPYIGIYSLGIAVHYEYRTAKTYLNHYVSGNIFETRGSAKKLNDSQISIDGITYNGQVNDEDFEEGLVLCFYEGANDDKNILCCYSISSLDFDNPKPINGELPVMFSILEGELHEYRPGLKVDGR